MKKIRKPHRIDWALTDEVKRIAYDLTGDDFSDLLYVTDTNRGRSKYRIYDGIYNVINITVPKWACNRPYGFLIWYVAHELAHYYSVHGKTYNPKHGPEFMESLKMICPDEYLHYETNYKPRNAMAAGISKSLN